MAKQCSVCGNICKGGLKAKLTDGYLCQNCNLKAGVIPYNTHSIALAKRRIESFEKNKALYNSFSPTISIDDVIEIDEEKKLIRFFHVNPFVTKSNIATRPCYSFSDIINFELIQNGETITSGGLGRAAVGGLAFSGVGAVVGAVTGKRKTKNTINEMYIRISLNNEFTTQQIIRIINFPIKQNSLLYDSATKKANLIISHLERCVAVASQPESTSEKTNINVSDELLKFKELLDAGLITRDEFDIQKAALLNQNTPHAEKTIDGIQDTNNLNYKENTARNKDYSNVGVINEQQKSNTNYGENTNNKDKYSNIGVINETKSTDSNSLKSSIHLWVISIVSIVAYACVTGFAFSDSETTEVLTVLFSMIGLALFVSGIVFFVKAIKKDTSNGNKRKGITVAMFAILIFILIPSVIVPLF